MADAVVLEPEWLRASRMRSDTSASDKGGPGASISGEHSPGDMGPKYSREFMIKVFREMGDFPMPDHLRSHDFITPPSGLKLPLIADCPLTDEEKGCALDNATQSPASVNSTVVSRANSTFGRGRRTSLGRGTGRPVADMRRPDGDTGIGSMSMSAMPTSGSPWRDPPQSKASDLFWGGPDEPARANGAHDRTFRVASMPAGAEDGSWERPRSWRNVDNDAGADFGADTVDELLADIRGLEGVDVLPDARAGKPMLSAMSAASNPGVWDSPLLAARSPMQSPLADLVSAQDTRVTDSRTSMRSTTPVGSSAPTTPTLGMPPQVWYYKDPNNNVQGPFTNQQMLEWHAAGYFSDSLLLAQTAPDSFVALGTVLKLRGGVSPFVPLPALGRSQNPLPMHSPLPYGSLAGGWHYGMGPGPGASFAQPMSSPQMHMGWQGSMSMDAMGGYMTASMMQQQESLRQTQETIRRLEMEIAQHEESERSLQQVQAELYGENQAEEMARIRADESSIESELEQEMERLRLAKQEEERQLAEMQSAKEAALRDLESSVAENSAPGLETEPDSAVHSDAPTSEPATPSTAEPATPAPSDKKKKKKKASSAGPTPVTTNNPSAVAPVPTPSSKAVHEAPPASATKPTAPSVPAAVPVAPMPPPRSLLEIQEEEERLRKERVKQQEKERAERLADAIRAEKALKWAEKPVVQPRALSLAEIQEQEARLLEERKKRDAAQQARVQARISAEPPIKLEAAKWNVKPSGNSSLADIQRQELAQKTKSAPLASAPPAVSPPAVVANVATANSFWDLADDEEEPMAKAMSKSEKKKQKKAAQQQAISTPAQPAAKPVLTASQPPARPMSQDEFRRWAASELSMVTSAGQSLDCLTFVTLLDEMPSPMKVVEMIQEVLGTGNDAKEFSRSFLERKRINVQLQQQAAQQPKAMTTTAPRPAPAANVRTASTPPPPSSSAWPSLGDSSAANAPSAFTTSTAASSKKGKKKGQKLDPSILGFTVNNPERMNVGEIQAADDA